MDKQLGFKEGRKLKLDLHTHLLEATRFTTPTLDIVRDILERVKLRGLDGIAITEHSNKSYGYQVKDIVEHHFDNHVLIIPGREIMVGRWEEVVELFLPDDMVFRFWAHPRELDAINDLGDLQGIEIQNGMHNWHLHSERVRHFAEEHGLLMLSNSDAHYLNDIGQFYNEITLEELCRRAMPLK